MSWTVLPVMPLTIFVTIEAHRSFRASQNDLFFRPRPQIEQSMNELRVVEFGAYYAAPLVGRYLAKFGCEVTCVERPEASGRSARRERARMGGALYENLRRGKTRLTLDLPRDRRRARALIETQDVLLDGFAPGVLDRLLGVGAEWTYPPRLRRLLLPGFHPSDTGRCKAFEANMLASAGVFRWMGLNRTLLGVETSFSDLPLASVYGSIFGLYALATSLVFPESNASSSSASYSPFEPIVVPLASALADAMVHNTVDFPRDETYTGMRERHLRHGEQTPVTPARLRTLLDPFFCTYLCADHRPFYLVCPAHSQHQPKALRLLGVSTDNFPVVDTYAERVQRGIGRGHMTEDEATVLRPLMQSAFLARTAHEWEELFGRAGVPGAACRTPREWRECSHVRASGLMDAGTGDLANLGWLVFDSAADDGGDEKEREGIAAGSEPEKEHRKTRMRVIDTTNVIAGPTIGKMLARAGMEVIKVDPIVPRYSPDVTVLYGFVVNMGKRSILLDLSDPRGREALERLLADADVLLVNAPEEALQRLRLTRAELRHVNPRLILAQFDAYSGPNSGQGRMTQFRGYDDCVQAATGIMYEFGGGTALEDAEEHAQVGLIDVVSGVSAAATTLFALYERRVTGRIATARSSLCATGQYLQVHRFLGDALQTRVSKVYHNGFALGERRLYRHYAARDGPIFVAAVAYDADDEALLWASVKRTFGYDVSDSEEDDVGTSSTLVAHLSMEEACRRLCEVPGVAACPSVDLATRRRMPSDSTFRFRYLPDHPLGGVTIVQPCFGSDEALCDAPKYGSHTKEILQEIRKTELLWLGVASTAYSREYLPFSCRCDACDRSGRRCHIMQCEHALCIECLSCARCRVCGTRHDTSVLSIRARILQHRRGYGAWRRGAAHGSHGELTRLYAI